MTDWQYMDTPIDLACHILLLEVQFRENCILKDFVTICWESCNCHSPAFHPRRFPPAESFHRSRSNLWFFAWLHEVPFAHRSPPVWPDVQWERSYPWSSPRCANCELGGFPGGEEYRKWSKMYKFSDDEEQLRWQVTWEKLEAWCLESPIESETQYLDPKEGVLNKFKVNVWRRCLQQDSQSLSENAESGG